MALLQYAAVAYRAGNYDKALELYDAAWNEFKNNTQFNHLILSGLAYTHAAKNDPEKAISYFQQVVADENAILKDQALFHLGLLLDETGEPEKSADAYNRIVSDHPQSVYAEIAKAKLAG
mgnify:FL=1